MEMALNMGAFEALGTREMMEIEGGSIGPAVGKVVKFAAESVAGGILYDGVKALVKEAGKIGNVLKNGENHKGGSINPIPVF